MMMEEASSQTDKGLADARWIVISPTPPPVHGAAIATEMLLGSSLAKEIEFVHIDTKFNVELKDLQAISVKKVMLLVRFGVQAVVSRFRGSVSGVILTPSFFWIPFLKDSIFIWICWFLRYPNTVSWFHMDFSTMQWHRRSWLSRLYVRVTLQRCRTYVCVAPRLEDQLPDFLRKGRRVNVMNGVAGPEGIGSGEYREDGGCVELLYVSNMSLEKGWDILLRLACSLSAELENLNAKFYGAPTRDSTEGQIVSRFSEPDVPAGIEYGGYIEGERKAKAFLRASIFCFPSKNEAFPLTILEAMSYGLPVVCFDVGAVRDAVIDGMGGFVVPKGDTDAFRSSVELLSRDPRRRMEMGAFNRSRFESMFTKEKYVSRWRSLLWELETRG
jgi:glycosyltransferase involved in cell wall biosynthesis